MNWWKSQFVHERRIMWLALLSGLPAVVASEVILFTGDYSAKIQWTATLFVVGIWLMIGLSIRERVASPLRTLANLLEAMREGDYSIRGRQALDEDALGDVLQQINAMGTTLQSQRLGALEATTLLRKVMEEINVAVFAFDGERKLRLVNRAGERLLNTPAERIMNAEAASIGLEEYLDGEPQRTVQRGFAGNAGRWGISRAQFREGGLPLQLLVITDLTRPLREEELQAWQRLVRVLGHELNNSLTPIKSIAGSLEQMLIRTPRAEDWEDDMKRGLSVIATRAESLARFMGAYARLAKLPRPELAPVEIGPLVERVAKLESRVRVVIEGGPAVVVPADRDQLEQLLINLVKNGAEASLEMRGTEPQVTIGWLKGPMGTVELWVRDTGPGLSNTANLFVPFFTTKPGGSGIGLVLSRQIIEGHGGTLALSNIPERVGCEARITLPA
ncbi:sensor histidine kinase [Bryobacterales bacterium F-183]|nr:sensor histidine kinase [Bryobacterales bacterium F-183]